MQLRVFGFGQRQDGDVAIGVFPEGAEILVGGERESSHNRPLHQLRKTISQKLRDNGR
jgi:hypothetical protein